jgi:hypothetical protein
MKYSDISELSDQLNGHVLGRAMRVAVGLCAVLTCVAASAQDDPLQQRRQELRSTVRQQGGYYPQQGANPVAPVNYNKPPINAPTSTSAENAAKPANLRHLSAEERTELRRQLARELRAQRGPSNAQ